MGKRKPMKDKSASNKERDQAIGHLYSGVDQLSKDVHQAIRIITLYIDFRRDGKRFKKWLDKKNKTDKAKVDKIRHENMDKHEEEMRAENG